MARWMHPYPGTLRARKLCHMRHFVILGFSLAVLTAVSAAQSKQTQAKHLHDGTKSAKSVVVAKAPPSTGAAANLRRLEQQSTKMSAPQRVKRPVGSAALPKAEKEKRTPAIRASGASAKGPGTTNQGANPYRGRLRQKGSHH